MSSLLTLTVENFVLIERAEVELAAGLTIVSGQTGAGKSLLLRALAFLLGERLQLADVIGRGRKSARVEGIFAIDEPGVRLLVRELGLGQDWDGEELSLSRTMDASGRSRARINGRATTLANLRKVAGRLVSILSQHEYQRLVRPELQAQVVDAFGEHSALRDAFDQRRRELAEGLRELDELRRNQREQRRALERAREEYALIEALAPEEGEFEAATQEIEVLRRAEEMRAILLGAVGVLSEEDESVGARLKRTQRRIEGIADVLPEVGGALDALERAIEEVNDGVHTLSRAERAVQDDPRRLSQLESRLGAYRELSRRLRVTPELLHEEYERLSGVVVNDVSERIASLEAEAARGLEALADLDDELAARRRGAAGPLGEAIEASLRDLGMDQAKLTVQVTDPPPRAARLRPEEAALPPFGGSAQVTFVLAANPGEAPRPVSDVASGGELSRIMLSLQRHLGKVLDVALLVFDEVDQNVGGRLGPIIGRELAALARERQVLVISHLPQVAAFADRHILATKATTKSLTKTRFRAIEGEDRIEELAAMTRGQELTRTSLDEARELLASASQAR